MQLLSYIGVFLLLILRDNRNPIKFPKYLLFYLLFILYVFYSDLYRLNREFKVMYLFSNPLIGGLNIMFIIENVSVSRFFYKKILDVSKIILKIALVVILIQQTISPDFFVNNKMSALKLVIGDDSNVNRLVSIYSWLGGFIKVGFAFVPIFLLIVEERIHKKTLYLWVLGGLIFSFLTKARWVMVNTLLVFVLLFIHQRIKIAFVSKTLILVPFFLLIAFVSLEFIGVNIQGIVKERILESDKQNLSQKSAGTRILAIKALNTFFWEHPIFGRGNIKYGMGGTGKQDYRLREFLKGRSSQIHVGYASLLYMYGVVGASFFYGFIVLLLKRLYSSAKRNNHWGSFFGFLGFVLANFTLVTFSVFEMGLILSLFANSYHNQVSQKINRRQVV